MLTRLHVCWQVSELEGISAIRGPVGSFVTLKGKKGGSEGSEVFEYRLERRKVLPRPKISPAPIEDGDAKKLD